VSTVKPPSGWNTWDYRSYVTFVYLDKGVRRARVRLAVYEPETMTTHDDFWWPAVARLGEHAWDGAYVSLGLKVGDDVFDIEAAGDGTKLWCRVKPAGDTTKRVVVVLTPDGPTSWERGKGGLVAGGYALQFRGATHNENLFLNINDPYVVGKPGAAVSFVCAPKRTRTDARAATGALATARRKYLDRAVAGRGALDGLPEGVVRGLTWNTEYDPYVFGISSPVSRTWSRDWGGVPVFDWDNSFAAILGTLESPEVAWGNLTAVLTSVDVLGFVPNFAVSNGALSLDRSQPPVVSYCAWKVHGLAPNKAQLKALYPKLLRWHRWWWKHRDGNGDGLLEWGSNTEAKYVFPFVDGFLGEAGMISDWQYAAFESGLDNSPMWDDVPFNAEARTFELASVDLNALFCLDAEYLAKIARECGDPKTARALDRERAALADRINDRLWDEERGAYLNRLWNGRFSDVLTPVTFYPLLAGIPSRERAERLVVKHMLNPDEFWGDYVIPSVARNHPSFADNNYWRGRIWGSMNFLVAEGLARYRFDEVAYEYAKRGLRPFTENWRELDRIYENYNATTGVGGDVPNSEPIYHWGGLLGYVAMQQLVAVEPDGGLRFGNLAGDDAELANVPARGHRYTVRTGAKGIHVLQDGAKLLATDCPAILRGFEMTGRTIRFDLYAEPREVTITFFGLKPNSAYTVELSGSRFQATSNAKGTLRVEYGNEAKR